MLPLTRDGAAMMEFTVYQTLFLSAELREKLVLNRKVVPHKREIGMFSKHWRWYLEMLLNNLTKTHCSRSHNSKELTNYTEDREPL